MTTTVLRPSSPETATEPSRSFYEQAFGLSGHTFPSEVIEVDDVEDALCRAWDLGGTVVSGPRAVGTHTVGTVRDPDGRLVRLVEAS